nr:hypothetical protein [uncultured Flavobacterium sp.]
MAFVGFCIVCQQDAWAYFSTENRYDLHSPDGSGNPLVPVPKHRDGTGDCSVQQDKTTG